MNDGKFLKIGDTPHSVKRELRAAYRSDAQRGWNPDHLADGLGPYRLDAPHGCGSWNGVRLATGICCCLRCGRALATPQRPIVGPSHPFGPPR